MDFQSAGLLDLVRLWRSGKIGEALELWEAIKTRDIEKIAKELGDVLTLFGLDNYSREVAELTKAIKVGKWADIGFEACDVAKLVFAEFRTAPDVPSVPGIQIVSLQADAAARKPVSEFTAAEAEQWLADNKAAVRSASGASFTRFVLRRLPEIRDSLNGDGAAIAKIAALDPETVVKWLNRAIFVLTAASVVYPPLGAVVVVLKLILARYESNNPEIGLAVTALSD